MPVIPHPRLIAILKQVRNPSIRSLTVALGDLFPLDESQFRLQWVELTAGTALARAELFIHRIPAEHQCMVCFKRYRPVIRETSCPHCGSVGAKVLAGEECFLESLEVNGE